MECIRFELKIVKGILIFQTAVNQLKLSADNIRFLLLFNRMKIVGKLTLEGTC